MKIRDRDKSSAPGEGSSQYVGFKSGPNLFTALQFNFLPRNRGFWTRGGALQ